MTYPGRLDDPGWEQKLQRFGAGLYGLGPHGSLVGRALSTLDVGARAEAVARYRGQTAFEDVDVEADTLPLYVRGVVTDGPGEPVSLAVSVNGVIAATTLSYRESGEWAFGSMLPEEALIAGDNDIAIFVVDGAGDQLVLRPASRERQGGGRDASAR